MKTTPHCWGVPPPPQVEIPPQTWQGCPPPPQAALEMPSWQTPAASQQPFGQDAGPQAHAPCALRTQPQTPIVPAPPQVSCGSRQPPQWIVPPQPSGWSPHIPARQRAGAQQAPFSHRQPCEQKGPLLPQDPVQVDRTHVPAAPGFGWLQAQPIGQSTPTDGSQAPPQPSASGAMQVPP